MKKLSVLTFDNNGNVAVEFTDDCLSLPSEEYIEAFDNVVKKWEEVNGYTVDSGGDENADEFTVEDDPYLDMNNDEMTQLLGGLFAQLFIAARKIEQNKKFESTIPEDFSWMRKGMEIKTCPEKDAILVNGKNYVSMSQFERTYGKITSGEKLAQDFFWHVKGLHAWNNNIKNIVFKGRDQGVVNTTVDSFMNGHDIPKEYIILQLEWWGFKVMNETVNLYDSYHVNSVYREEKQK